MRTTRRVALGAILPLVLVGTYAISAYLSPSPFFPPISRIMEMFVSQWLSGWVLTDIVPSLSNFALGYLIAVVTGVLLGLVLGRLSAISDLMMPALHFARNVPPLMLIPPLVLLLGVGDASKAAIIALGSFFPIALATIDGVRQTDPHLRDAATAMKLTHRQRIVQLWFPAATPSMFGGLQTGLQFALVLMVASEMLAATRGVGYRAMQAQLTFNAAGVWSGIVLLAIIGFAMNAAFVQVRRRVLRWHIGMREQSRAQ
ncbi:ABC transporter permease [Microbacterium sp. RD1]|uniref:ABC transporter permease n=1 Tax=Microbacterium sp. RD1 TaxID=3457313 RepID=UPI003FA59CC4